MVTNQLNKINIYIVDMGICVRAGIDILSC